MSALSAFFGFDGGNRMRREAEQRAAQNLASAQQYQAQWLANHNTSLAGAQQAQQAAGSDYNTYKQQGQQRYADSTSALNGLLPLFANAGGATGYGGNGGSGGGTNPYAPQGTPQSGAQGQGQVNRTTPGTTPNSAAGTLNRNQRATSTQNSVKAGGAGNVVGQAQSAMQFDPYQLTEPQQMQLNGQTDRINAQKQSAMENLRASYAQRGITDPRAMQAGMQTLEEQFGGAAEQSKAQFLEQNRVTKQQTYGQLLDFFSQQQGQGQQQQLQGIQGGEQQIGNLQQLGANPALMQMLGRLDQNANIDIDRAGQLLQQNNIGQNLLSAGSQALGLYLGGAFNKPRVPEQIVRYAEPHTVKY